MIIPKETHNGKLSTWFDNQEAFETALSDAESSASTNFEIEFVSDVSASYRLWSMNTFMSPKQFELLNKIAGN